MSVPFYLLGLAGSGTWTDNIPAVRPRLWLNGSRLATAQAWLLAHPFTPSGSDYGSQAFIYACNGNPTYGAQARDWAYNLVVTTGFPDINNISSDYARWYGEIAILCFDWTYPLWSAPQIAAYIAQWNSYCTILQAKPWGGINGATNYGVSMSLNNYFWGYLRDMLEWGITSWQAPGNEAQTNIDRAITSRYLGDFQPYVATGASKGGLGGIPYEGTQYGAYPLGYGVIPLWQVGDYGRVPTLYNETPWWKQSVCWMAYHTMPRSTIDRSGLIIGTEMFPFGDDENWDLGDSAKRIDYGSFMNQMADTYGSIYIGQYAQTWMNYVVPPVDNWIKPFLVNGTARPWYNLTNDYWADGVQFMYTRSSWNLPASSLLWQLGEAGGGPSDTGHNHLDSGSFQIWRGDSQQGHWLSRSDVGYIRDILNWSGVAVDVKDPCGYNSVLFHGRGEVVQQYQFAGPTVQRLESSADWSYAAVSLTSVYRANNRPQVDNPYAKTIVREMLYFRQLETLCVYDRLEASSDSIPAATVEKTQLVHFEQSPTISGQSCALEYGRHGIRATSVLPAGASLAVVNELAPGPNGLQNGHPVGQYRLQIETSGSAQSEMLMVVQSRAALAQGGQNLTIAVTDQGTSWKLDITHPTLGGATWVIVKGMTSSGGQAGYLSTGLPGTLTALSTTVQGFSVGDSGPAWSGSGWSNFGALIGHQGATGTQNPPIAFDSGYQNIFVSDRVGVSKASMANPSSWTYMDWLSTNPNGNKIANLAVNALGNPLVCDIPRPTRIGAAVWNGSSFVTASFTPALASSTVIAGFAVDPLTGYIYTASNYIIYRSTDNGFTYNQIFDLRTIEPATGWIYGIDLMPWGEIITGGESAGFFSSLDGGVTFTALPAYTRSGNRYGSIPTKTGEILLSSASDASGDFYFATYTTANALANSITPLPQFMDPNSQHLAYSAYSGEDFVAAFNRFDSNKLLLLRWNGTSWLDIGALADGPGQEMLVGSTGSDGTNIYVSTSSGQVKKWTPQTALPFTVTLGPTLSVSVNVATALPATVSPAGSYTYAWSARGNAHVSFSDATALHPNITINAAGYYAVTLKATSAGVAVGQTFIVHAT